ncbi:MAG: MFS transporter [Aquabacterium sp.]|jgi:PAT family beta-lactamase induction signal transducer AmpG|nr:MFS transporter [Aquabacterium sp.]
MHRHPLALLSSLYAAQGLPFGFFTLALPVLMREAGWSLTAIGLLQLLALPWLLKFLWAPWVDHHGARRTWLLGLQGCSVVAALTLALLDLGSESRGLLLAVLVFNLLAATQDIVTDGLAVRVLAARERGLANAIQVGAYRLGMILGGGGLLWLWARTNGSTVFAVMAGLLALSTWPVWQMRELPPGAAHDAMAPRPRPSAGQLALGWWHRALAPGMLTFAALVFCFRFGDQMVSSLITPFVSDQGASKETIALMKGAVGSGASLLGALLGGALMVRVNRRTAMLSTGLGQAMTFALYIAAALGFGGMPLLWWATVAEGVVGTMATVALFALMMDASDPDHAGTDFTLLASVVVGVGSLGGIAGGVVGDAWGYVWAFGIGTVLSALGCVAMVTWLDRRPTHARVAQAWR